MGNAKLVEVVEMSQAEDYWCAKDDGRVGGLGEKEERDGAGSEEDFFCNGAL